MKIFSYCGSRREKSITKQVIDMLIKELEGRETLEVVSYSPQNLSLQFCCGCSSCFEHRKCPMDRNDGFDHVKMELLKADIVLFGTPVYACSISGDMKVFVDRISHMMHLMALRGKIGIPVIIASSNSLVETNEYVKKLFDFLGAFVPFSVMCTVDRPRQFDSLEFREVKIPQYAEEILAYGRGEKRIVANRFQESYFKKMRQLYMVPIKDNSEVEYWKDNGMLEYDSYQELLDARKEDEKC